ncbi:MAG: hypothetical protein JKY96_09445 [Phycisphaerales bacterium]|nr:hypothetical protein [Phycisphaerales bacterium]
MRCLTCQYPLSDLQTPQCPECGRRFNSFDASTFDTRPPFLFWRYWLPGVALAIIIGFLGFAGLSKINSTGWAIWIGVPIVAGIAMGIYCRVKNAMLIMTGLFVIGGVVVSLAFAHIAGIFCAVILYVVCILPFGFGVFIGYAVREDALKKNPMFRAYLPLILLTFPFAWHLLGGAGGGHTKEISISTTRIVIGEPEDVWDALMFFEDVESNPPLLMRIALPRPLYTQGPMDSVGDRRVCVYTKGKLTKEITEVSPSETLAFTVVEQEFEPSVRLTRGRFALEDLGDGRTRLTLTTRYVPVHSPRFVWHWAEIVGARTLHTHVINGIESQILERGAALAEFEGP